MFKRLIYTVISIFIFPDVLALAKNIPLSASLDESDGERPIKKRLQLCASLLYNMFLI